MRYLFLILVAVFALAAFRGRSGFTISGKVLDEKGVPVSNATVKVKNSSNATLTDVNGAFTIKVSGSSATLVISAIGYNIQELSVKDNGKPVSITLKAGTTTLQEVVVTGVHSRRKEIASKTSGAPATANYGHALPGQLAGRVSGLEAARDRRYPGSNGGGLADSLRYNPDFNTEGYDAIIENRFLTPGDNPLSTFSIDVDAAAYSNVRRFLESGQLPPAGAVRIEEMINYFKYDYPQPTSDHPFSINTEIAECPWNPAHKLVMIGLQGKKIPVDNLPPSNLVFLIDVSGSMMAENKLPLVRASMKLLTDQLRPQDKVAIVVYAGNAGLVLPATSGDEKAAIKEAIDKLEAGGSTAGGAGIRLAYSVAKQNFLQQGNNRVILCTDGDFNVGASSNDELERLIEEERKSGVFLTVLGYGTGNYQDSKMQRLADKGNGNHAYIDNFNEARKVLVSEFGGTLFTIAKDVKLQIEFNPAKVGAYRLIGYENRLLNKEDFNNDQKDAGDLGSGHTVTALYEIIPAGVASEFIEPVDKLKYQRQVTAGKISPEIMTVKFRYKEPDQGASKLMEVAVMDTNKSLRSASDNFRFAASVASFSMLLRHSEFRQQSSYGQVWKLAKESLGNDEGGYRSEFLKLLKSAQSLADVGSSQ